MPNRLAQSQSPYLRQHADNPVDWYEWCEEAFGRARTENKPIFLSIGYSTCHWCHVMAHESFENPDIAALLNTFFISIKVDREERPDVDRIYMTYVQAMTGHGGWPLSAWLAPTLQPFYGGTYFPPADRGGRAGFASLLRAIGQGWQDPTQRETMIAEGHRALNTLREHASASQPAHPTEPTELFELAQNAFEQGYRYFYEAFDAEDGGFGGAPKFPRASVLSFLLRCAAIQGEKSNSGKEAIAMVSHTLRQMACGGIHDHVGGGFHRYSVDERWFVPHFEKMLYDQAQIAVNYLDARRATGDERHAWLARDILGYMMDGLGHPAGGFYSAEDADSLIAHGRPEHAEGAFYVWTRAELAAELGADDLELVVAHFGVKEDGNVPPETDPHRELVGKNILAQQQPLAATASAFQLDPELANTRLLAALAKLRQVRTQRPRPHLDNKIITAWNGLAISALAKAHVQLERGNAEPPRFLDAATNAARFIQRELFDPEKGVLYRAYGTTRGATQGFAEDYAFMIEGLLDLYEASFDACWLQWADQLQSTLDTFFWDDVHGGYFSAMADDPNLVLRLKEDYDGAEPSPNSVAAGNLLRFATMLHDDARRDRALRTLAAFRAQWTQHPQALPGMLTCLELAVEAPRQVVLAGDPRSSDFKTLAAVVTETRGPRRSVLAATDSPESKWLIDRSPWLAAMKPIDGQATAYVCENFTCQAPVTDVEELRRILTANDSEDGVAPG